MPTSRPGSSPIYDSPDARPLRSQARAATACRPGRPGDEIGLDLPAAHRLSVERPACRQTSWRSRCAPGAPDSIPPELHVASATDPSRREARRGLHFQRCFPCAPGRSCPVRLQLPTHRPTRSRSTCRTMAKPSALGSHSSDLAVDPRGQADRRRDRMRMRPCAASSKARLRPRQVPHVRDQHDLLDARGGQQGDAALRVLAGVARALLGPLQRAAELAGGDARGDLRLGQAVGLSPAHAAGERPPVCRSRDPSQTP